MFIVHSLIHGGFVLSIILLMGVFFSKRRVSRLVMVLAYVVFWFAPGIELLFLNTTVTSLLVNILVVVFIVFIYDSSMIKKIIAIISALSFMFVINMVALFVYNMRSTEYIQEYSNFYDNVNWAIIAFRWIVLAFSPLILALVLRRYKNIKKDNIPFPMLRVYVLFFLVSFSFYIYIITQFVHLSQTAVFLIIVLLLVLNILAHYLHNVLSVTYDSKVELALRSQESEYYLAQS